MATGGNDTSSNSGMQNKLDKDLWYACVDGDIMKVKRLIQRGATMEYNYGGKTPLEVAAHMNHVDILDLLMKKYKPDINHPDERGCTTLHFSCAQGQTSTVQSLINNGANIECQTENGKTPFFLSCHVGNMDVVKLLVKKGANRHIQTKTDSLTPIEIAKNENHTELIEYLTKIEKYESSLQTAISDHLEEYVEIEFTKFSIHGAAGSGKTCLQHLLLNDPPPAIRESTDFLTGTVLSTTREVTTSVMATSASGPSNPSCGMQRVDNDQSLHLLVHQAKSTLQIAREDSESTGATPLSDEVAAKKRLRRKSCLKRISFLKNRCRQQSAAEPRAIEFDSGPSEPATKSFVSCGMLSILPTALESDVSVRLRWIYGTDSGGQPAFQDIAPAFLRHCSVVLLTLKLNERLDEYPKFEYMHKGQYVEQDGRTQLTNLQMVLTLARSLSSILQPPCGKDTAPICRPKLMIVGTFYDQRNSCTESLDEKNAILERELEPYHDILIRTTEGTPIHPVDTLLKPEDGRQTRSEELCKALLQINGAKETVRVPLSQLMFQFEIFLFAESNRKEILSLEECYAVGRAVKIYEESRVLDALKHLDKIGLLFYFHNVLPNLVFVKPHAILKFLSDLVSFSFFNSKQAHSEYTITSTDHKQLCASGCFSKSLLQALFYDHQETIFTIDGFIELMEHLLVLAQVPGPNHPMYFLPCVLPWEDLNEENTDALIDTKDASPIFLAWESQNSQQKCAIPYGIFIGTINSLLSLQEPKFSLNLDGRNRRNAVFLKCASRGSLLILDRVFHIELRFKGQASCCSKLLLTVKQCIAATAERFHYHRNLGSVSEYFMSPCESDHTAHRVMPGEMNGQCQLTGVCEMHDNTIVLNHCQSVWLENKELVLVNVRELMPQDRELENKDIPDIAKALQPISYDWYIVGINMGLPKYRMESIARSKAPVEKCLIDTIDLWLQNDFNCTTNGLIVALKKMVHVKIICR